MTNIQIKYKEQDIKFLENKTYFVNIKLYLHPFIYKKLGLHYDQYELNHNNMTIKDETVINMIYLHIDTLCLDIKINSELECMNFILKSNDVYVMNNCYLCGIPTQDRDICSFCYT